MTVAFLVVVLLAAGLEWVARRDGSEIPTLGETSRWLLAHRARQVAILLLWWWAGWHFLAR